MRKKVQRALTAIFALGLLLALPAAATEDPYLQPNNAWISLSGTVKSVAPDSFTLDYGEGIVTVEMDDGDRDADAYKLIEGDKVTVSGVIDDDLFETTTIEASSVFVESINTYFYASPEDEEDALVIATAPVVVAETYVQGTVTDVAINEFTLDTGTRKLKVEVDGMPYDPLDDEGLMKIEVGDRVSVRGHMDHDFWEGQELEADSVTKIWRR